MGKGAKKLTVKDILAIPCLDYFIEPENCKFFIKKQSDYEAVANIVNSSKIDAVMDAMNEAESEMQDSAFGTHQVVKSASDVGLGLYSASDNFMTHKMAEKMKSEYIYMSDKISPEKLLLFLAAVTHGFLQEVDAVKNGKTSGVDSLGISELTYANGDIITTFGREIVFSTNGNKGVIDERKLQEIQSKMVEAILIANTQLNSLNKNMNISIFGNYKQTGQTTKLKRISFSTKELQEYAQSGALLSRLSVDKMKEFLSKDLISKNTLLKLMAKGEIDKNIAVQFMVDGVFSQEEVLSRVFKVRTINDLSMHKDANYESKLLMYSIGKINIDLLEKSVSEYQKENIDLTEILKRISGYYTGDIKRISELLTHHVLDHSNSQIFLKVLQEDGRISAEDRAYLDRVMVDFKTNELLNDTENEIISVSTGGGQGGQNYKAGLTIDPHERLRYLQSLGAVKKVKIRGENFIKDSESNIGKKNSLDGYELFVIPEKRIAILEKLYETTRDKNSQIQYRRNKQGKLIPAVGNATYVIPIEMALEFSRKKNKKELIESPDVRRVSHSMEWVSNLESKVSNLMRLRGIEVEFDKTNTKVWAARIRKNYLENKERREKIVE